MNPIQERDALRKENTELRSEIERLENLTASGIHTCHADCQRPMCVLRRERDKALADLTRVTAELDAATKRAQRFNRLHAREDGKFAGKDGASK